MIHLSLAIHCIESSSASPTFSILTGSASEALPDTPGQVEVTLSETYSPPQGYEVRYRVSDHAGGDPETASFIAPGETQLTGTAFTGTAYVKLYLVRTSDGVVVQQTELPAVDILEASTAPSLSNVVVLADGATTARASVTPEVVSGLIYWVATTSETAPEASSVLEGKDHAGATVANSGSVPVDSEDPVQIAISDLKPGETYYIHFLQRTSEGALSGVASSAAVTPVATVIEDITNPVLEDIFDDVPLRTAWQGITVDDYVANNGASITDVAVTYEIDGETVTDGEISGTAGDALTVSVTVTASDGAEARFVYGPATISAAPVIDITPPVLSDFALSANGPDVLRGSVVTTEAGGILHLIGAPASTTLAETAVIESLDGTARFSPDLSAEIPVSEGGIVPLAFTGLAPEKTYNLYCCQKDAAGNLSNIVKTSARTLSVENLKITVEDFSRDKVPFHSKRVEGTAPAQDQKAPTSKEEVLALADDPSVGSQHEGPYKIPGQNSLPEGMSISGTTVTVTDGFSGWLEGWDFTGYTIIWRSGRVQIRNCIFGEKDGNLSGAFRYIDIYPEATVVEISQNDILGPNGYGGAGVAVSYRTTGSGTEERGPAVDPGLVRRNKFFGLTSDAIKPTGGIVEENTFVWQYNLDDFAYAWDANKTYAAGNLARNSKDHVFRSKTDKNKGQSVPSNKSDNAYWENLDPHVDAINPRTVTHPLIVRRNYVNMSADPDRAVGMNNCIRSIPNSNADSLHLQVDYYENVMIHPDGENSRMIQSVGNDSTNFVPDRFYNNWFQADSPNKVMHSNVEDGTVWENNIFIPTGEVIPPLDKMVEDASLITVPHTSSAETNISNDPLYLAEVNRSGLATPGHAIEARAVPEGGGQPTDWSEIAKADAAGHWSGTLEVPRGPHPYRFEVRLKDAPYVTAKTTRTFVSGLLIAMHTQSDIASPALKDRSPWVKIDPEPLLKDDLVQMFYLEGFDMDAPEQPEANLRRVFLSNETPYSPGMAAMANTFIDLMPDTPVAFIMHTVSGTSPTEMASDGNSGRDWKNDKKLHEFVVRDGNAPGLHANYFSSSYTGISKNFGEALAPIFAGRELDGTRFDTPGRHSYGWSKSLWIDHTYADLYDLDFTKTMILPIESIEEEDSLYNFVDAFSGEFRVGQFDIYNSSVGGRYNESKNRMDDTNHANSHKEWGAPRRMRMWALSMIEALGEQPLEQPLLDIVEVAPNSDGSMIRIGSTSGPISTLRKQLEIPELDRSKYPAYGDVFGIYVNGDYVDAYIGDDAGDPAREGWIYIPKPRGPFNASDIIGTRSTGFGRDHVSKPASGAPSGLDYYLDDAILSKPVVPSGIHHVWGLHAIMPKEAGDTFLYSDIVAGSWSGRVPSGEEEKPENLQEPVNESSEEEVAVIPDELQKAEGYVEDFSTDQSGLTQLEVPATAIVRHTSATRDFPKNGSLSGALELTGTSFSDTTFSFNPTIKLEADQDFELDLAAYASSLQGQTSTMAIRIYCDHDRGTDLLMEAYNAGALPGQILADLKGHKFTCAGPNGRVRIELLNGNPRNDKRRISLMHVAIRPL